MKFKIFLVLLLLLSCLSYSFCGQKNILYISDNIHLSENFDKQYVDMLDKYLEDSYGKNTITIKKFSRFDINTTESFDIVNSAIRGFIPNAVILMIGEANYYNIYGFSSYMTSNKNKKNTKAQQHKKSILDINEEMANMYNVKVHFFKNIVNTAYSNIIKVSETYKPKVVPNFYVLDQDFKTNNNILSTIEVYKHSWTLIKQQKFDEARNFLAPIIKKEPSLSMLYYAYASTYIMERKENYENNALKYLEEGILVDPYNKDNLCYKGLILMFMMYKGEITTEILYFAKSLNRCVEDLSDEITTIVMINTSEYSEKTKAIDSWVLYDIERIREFCIQNNIPLIYASYPEETNTNKNIETYINDKKNIFYLNNISDSKESIQYVIYKLANNMAKFLINNRILN